MRPKKTRWVKCDPSERCFVPCGKTLKQTAPITISLDEFEAMRLLDLEELTQEETAKRMKIHRSTVSRIIASAHKKLAKSLVDIQSFKIEGGCCRIIKRR